MVSGGSLLTSETVFYVIRLSCLRLETVATLCHLQKYSAETCIPGEKFYFFKLQSLGLPKSAAVELIYISLVMWVVMCGYHV